MPKLSVIVPVYNVEAYLARCVDSILAQSFADFELILVNDGTRDGSVSIMEEYARRDGRVRLVHKQNGGLSSARNAGLDVAGGEYVIFIDSDDWIAPELFADAVRAAEKTGATQVLWNYRRVWDDHEEGAYLPFRDEVIDLGKLGLARYFYDYFMPYRHGQEAWSKLYRMNVIRENQLLFEPNHEIFAEDTLFGAKYLMHTKKIAALAKPYVYYYQRADSIMAAGKPRLCARLIELGSRLTRYAQKTGHGRELQNVLPVYCYDKLFTKGIRLDPSLADTHAAMRAALSDETVRALLRALREIAPLCAYTINTRSGFATQVRGRLFAARWLRGDVEGAAALVQGRIGQ